MSKYLSRGLVVALMLALFSEYAHAGMYATQSALNQADEFALDPMFQSVGYVSVFGDFGEGLRGSGVLIHPEWVLTAGHVLLESGTTLWEDVGFGLDPSWFSATDVIHADAFFTFPGYSLAAGVGRGHDIGLMHLSTPIYDALPAVRFSGTDQAGTHVFMAGYGDHGVWPNSLPTDGLKRAGENVANRIGWPLITIEEQYWLADFGPAWSTPTLPMEWASNFGDSGGGWFNAQGELVGINSFVLGQNDNSGAIRVSLYNDWIDSHVYSVPEPSSAVMLMAAAISMLGVRSLRTYLR